MYYIGQQHDDRPPEITTKRRRARSSATTFESLVGRPQTPSVKRPRQSNAALAELSITRSPDSVCDDDRHGIQTTTNRTERRYHRHNRCMYGL